MVLRWCCSAHTGNEVSSCVGSVAEGPVVCFVGAVCFCGIACGLPVASQCFVGMGVLEAQDDAVVGVVRLLPSGLASGRLNTSTFSRHIRDIE